MSATDVGSTDEQKAYEDILSQEISQALSELNRSTEGLFLSGLSAGLDIGFGPLLMAVMATLLTGALGEPVTELLMANIYAIGFIFVILGRSELFTEHTTLAVLPVLDQQASLSQLGRLWGIVYAGNILGGIIFAGFAVVVGPATGLINSAAFTDIASSLTDHSLLVLIASGVFAGWLMGLLSWLVTAAQETISRIFFVWLIASTIGFAHLPHCIAGNVEVLLGLFASSKITFVDYGRFLVGATAGNVIGGTVFVALLKYGHVVRGGQESRGEPNESFDVR
ncbi:formate/nitrite transporter family protein [Haladaptatus caseinilyticus]|uniref:formate/nitrite transporter family protein n=1 Tax=Haladaptatus caseinilyticus TaxID=2993314 RepID=UPI00224AE843|nr:formate/nitrite transporter family protein [Haladaptatus caseinilyticus]